ncbi:MAG: ABC transporter ATP-binding protein [Rhodospirillaceae bacterium]|nr:ABC transporter ATP-binding protein [Rhodospirillaceae bacterium]
MTPAAEALLSARGLTHYFGGLAAISDVSFDVARGGIKGIIGPNGAGKTTLFNLLTGVTRLEHGSIAFNGQPIHKLPAYRRAARGVARTFQNLQLFPGMTVLENVMIGGHVRSRSGFLSAIARTAASRQEDRAIRERALAALDLLEIRDLADRAASDISFGEGKILEIARAVAAEPAILLLDEPTAGLPHGDMRRVAKVIGTIRDRGITVVLVEHNMRLVMSLCDDILVLNYGRKIAEGPADAVRRDPEVISAYLGGAA